MFNKVILLGNLTKDPILKYSPNGLAICEITIAVNERIGKREEVLFIKAVGFSRTAENINNFFKKGSPILIEGKLRLNTWTSKDGTKRFRHEILIERFSFVQRKKEELSNYYNKNQEKLKIEETKINNNTETSDEIDDEELPF